MTSTEQVIITLKGAGALEEGSGYDTGCSNKFALLAKMRACTASSRLAEEARLQVLCDSDNS